MSTFSSILTTAAVLIHSVLGCCWHHSHQCEWDTVSGVPPSGQLCRSMARHRGCSHHHHSQSFTRHESDNNRQYESDSGEPSDRGYCDGGSCFFISIVLTDTRPHTVWSQCPVSVDDSSALASAHAQPASVVRIDTAWRRLSGSWCALAQVWQV